MANARAADAVAAALSRLSTLFPKQANLSLSRMPRLLERLGHPERSLPPVVHVAGTNGKGSVVAYLSAMGKAAGLKVHAYTSPHLVRFNERIRVGGQEIDDDHLLDVLERCERANDGGDITYFEIATIAALLAFSENKADFALLEVGLGGRLDATNLVDKPLATAVTCISFDHQAFLGNTIEAIAGEKAGILKPGAPAIVGPQVYDAASQTLVREIAATGAIGDVHGIDWHYRRAGDALIVTDRDGETSWPLPALPGAHQWGNAATAVRLARLIEGLNENTGAQSQGLRQVEWPARLQRLHKGPLIDALGSDEVWLDGAHNDSGGAALAAWLAEQPKRPTTVLTAMLARKDVESVLRPLVGAVDKLIAVPIPDDSPAISPEDLAQRAEAIGISDVDWVADMKDAPNRVLPGGRVIICGSLYLAGAILAENG